MRIAEKLSLLIDALTKSPKPPGFPSFSWPASSALSKLKTMAADADREIAKVMVDPMIPPEGRLYRAGQLRSELVSKVAEWRTETLGALDAKIAAAIPTPPAANVSPAYASQLLQDFDAVDPALVESFYLSPGLPPEVARVIESAPARIIGGLGKVPRVALRVSEEAKAKRWYQDAPQDCRDRCDGLTIIRDSLAGAAGMVETAARSREE